MRKWLNGRASASQAGRCGFKSRLPLQKENAHTRAFFFCALYGKKNRCLCKQTNRSLSRAIEDCERHGAIAKLSRLPLQTAYKGALCALFACLALGRLRLSKLPSRSHLKVHNSQPFSAVCHIRARFAPFLRGEVCSVTETDIEKKNWCVFVDYFVDKAYNVYSVQQCGFNFR